MAYRLSRKSTEVYQFWRDFLDGAIMTHLDYAALGGLDSLVADAPVNVTRRIDLPTPPPGITMATLVKGAWSFVLAQITRQTDLVFGHVVNGRSVPIPGSETILGPCVNIIPVRVILQPGWAVQDLLEHVQAQHMQLLQYETSDLRDIVNHSTSWPSSTRFGSIVQHQNIDQHPSLSLDGIECTTSAEAFPPVTKDFYVVSEPTDDHLQVSISASSAMISSESAAKMLSQVCEAIISFSQYPDRRLSSLDIEI
jgi:non-ribosomal peptide synthetase component F